MMHPLFAENAGIEDAQIMAQRQIFNMLFMAVIVPDSSIFCSTEGGVAVQRSANDINTHTGANPVTGNNPKLRLSLAHSAGDR